MARYKLIDRSPRFLPVVLSEQIVPGTFEFALDQLVDRELDLSVLGGRFDNDETGAPAYDPRVMLKVVLLGYSRGLISSRAIERACRENVTFIALSGDSAPSYAHIAKFVRELGDDLQPISAQVLMVCDRLGLIGRELFAIDGVKLPAKGAIRDCGPCELRERCLRKPQTTKFRQVAINLHRVRPLDVVEIMRRAIDSPRGRALYSRRIGTVEPVLANLRHNKRPEPVHDARTMEGRNPVAAVLPGAQHREYRAMLSEIAAQRPLLRRSGKSTRDGGGRIIMAEIGIDEPCQFRLSAQPR